MKATEQQKPNDESKSAAGLAATQGSAMQFIERMHRNATSADALEDWQLSEALIKKVWAHMDMDSEESALVSAAIDRLREKDIGKLVDRFLAWPLPESVCSDQCACDRGYPHRTGTNLLTATEAKQMLEYLLCPPN